MISLFVLFCLILLLAITVLAGIIAVAWPFLVVGFFIWLAWDVFTRIFWR